jgi:hypothetical protein
MGNKKHKNPLSLSTNSMFIASSSALGITRGGRGLGSGSGTSGLATATGLRSLSVVSDVAFFNKRHHSVRSEEENVENSY